MLLNIEEIKADIKRYLEANDNEDNDILKSMGHRNSSSEREVYSNAILSQERRKYANKHPNLTS